MPTPECTNFFCIKGLPSPPPLNRDIPPQFHVSPPKDSPSFLLVPSGIFLIFRVMRRAITHSGYRPHIPLLYTPTLYLPGSKGSPPEEGRDIPHIEEDRTYFPLRLKPYFFYGG